MAQRRSLGYRWLLQTKALIMIIFVNILVNILLDKGIITSTAFTATLLMAVASTMLSIPMVSRKAKPLSSLPKEVGRAA